MSTPKRAPEAKPADAGPVETGSAIAEPDPATGRLPAGVYAYTRDFETCYVEVPLTARPGTVFLWADGAPSDGRWETTRRKPNQLPDNAPAAAPEED